MDPSHSGKFVLRIPSTLHQTLSCAAKARGFSLNTMCLLYLQAATEQHPLVHAIFDAWDAPDILIISLLSETEVILVISSREWKTVPFFELETAKLFWREIGEQFNPPIRARVIPPKDWDGQGFVIWRKPIISE